jgi:hypothetical protein
MPAVAAVTPFHLAHDQVAIGEKGRAVVAVRSHLRLEKGRDRGDRGPSGYDHRSDPGATVLMDGIGALDDRLGVLDRLRVPVEIDVVAVTIATELRCWPRPS